ncbi:hypothetical protein [Bacillus solimangrovi]|uniref:hypothetical protein n=1 Tax=Bacillus solimangrovi TaxID=1305675 RepID=UPI00158661DB|nr:hypothetical protein [Bacillus solimangrovi]
MMWGKVEPILSAFLLYHEENERSLIIEVKEMELVEVKQELDKMVKRLSDFRGSL